MDLCTEMIFTDPVVQRVFFDARRLAPRWGHDAIVNIAEYEISRLKVLLQKAIDVDFAESMQQQIRRQYFLARRHADGYVVDWAAGYDDGCEHVVMFAHGNDDHFFNIDHRARSRIRHRHKFRSTVQPRNRSRRT